MLFTYSIEREVAQKLTSRLSNPLLFSDQEPYSVAKCPPSLVMYFTRPSVFVIWHFLVIFLCTITIVPPTINTNRRRMITPAKVAMIIPKLEGDPEDFSAGAVVGSGMVGQLLT